MKLTLRQGALILTLLAVMVLFESIVRHAASRARRTILDYLDDLALIPIGIPWLSKMIPPLVLAECRVRAQEGDVERQARELYCRRRYCRYMGNFGGTVYCLGLPGIHAHNPLRLNTARVCCATGVVRGVHKGTAARS